MGFFFLFLEEGKGGEREKTCNFQKRNESFSWKEKKEIEKEEPMLDGFSDGGWAGGLKTNLSPHCLDPRIAFTPSKFK